MILMLQRDILSDRFWTPRLLHTGRSICWVVPVFCPCRWTTLPRWPGWRPPWRPLWRPPWRPLGFGFGRWAWRQRFRPWAVPAEGRSRHCLGFPGGRETSASCSYDWPTRGERERRIGWGREYGEEREMCEEEGAIQSALFFKLKHVVCWVDRTGGVTEIHLPRGLGCPPHPHQSCPLRGCCHPCITNRRTGCLVLRRWPKTNNNTNANYLDTSQNEQHYMLGIKT